MIDWNEVFRRTQRGNATPDRRVEKTEAEWREELDAATFAVTRQAGTERAFSSSMCELFEPGLYGCACCDSLLFDATNKFDSGTGWPSFTQPIQDNAIAYRDDSSYGMRRVETTCAVCDSHLGHVFPDGPPPSGLRYCMNAVALRKRKD
ncbi:MAG: peptide-methionine (R)-S-oxide reductase MsrB [Xanthomonadales bacterium]|nr:peptide-methionine (R)-S-oxide reductase MsrB [Xanthomonadales bacterium]